MILRPIQNKKIRKKKNKKRPQNGYVLVDVLVMVLIATISFSAIMGGLGTISKLIARSRDRVQAVIIEYNEFEKAPRITELD